MTIVRGPVVGPPAPAPVFTVGSALRWLGHACAPGCCSVPLQTLPADVLFLRSGLQVTYPLRTFILIDPADLEDVPVSVLDLHRVARCAHTDSISIHVQDDRRDRLASDGDHCGAEHDRQDDAAMMRL